MFQAQHFTDCLASYVSLLPAIFRTYGIDEGALHVIDCYCGEGDLVFLLMEQFSVVGSNDPNPRSPSPNKLSLDDVSIWKMIESNYNAIVTRITNEEQISFFLQNMSFYQSKVMVIALLVPSNVSPCLQGNSVDIEINSFKYKWQLHFPNINTQRKRRFDKIRNIKFHSLIFEGINNLNGLVKALFMLAEIRLFKNTRQFILSDTEPYQEESLFYREAKILKFVIEELTVEGSGLFKKDFVKLLGHGSYRSVQRKIRIATMAQIVPELKKLNLRDAETRIKELTMLLRSKKDCPTELHGLPVIAE